MLFANNRKSGSLGERAGVALAGLQRNAYALGVLRSRIESRISFMLGGGGSNSSAAHASAQELAKVLELVKGGEAALNELSGKIEAAKFLEEFVTIIDGATSSVGAIKEDVEQLLPAAEAALEEMHDTILKLSSGPSPLPYQSGTQQNLLSQTRSIMEEAAAAAMAVAAEASTGQAACKEEGMSNSAPAADFKEREGAREKPLAPVQQQEKEEQAGPEPVAV